MNVLMPQLGETVAEGTVAVWHKTVGDAISKGEILLDVETDKAATEVPAPIDGVLTEIRVAAGDTVDVGAVLAVIRAPGETDAETDAEPATVPALSVADLSPTSSGTKAADHSSGPVAARSDRLLLSPVVRRLLAEHELDPQTIEGSGRDGRITRADVIAAAASGGAQAAPQGSPTPTAGEAAPVAQPSRVVADTPAMAPASVDATRIPFDRIRRLTAEHMVRSKATSPHVLQAIEVDFGAIDAVRRQERERWRSKRGFSLTYLPFIARAVCLVLKEFPRLNASVDGDALAVHPRVHLSIAVALELEGLVAPVIRDASELTVAGLAQRIVDISRRAREHKLGPDDLSGGTYTLTNNGSFGTLMTAPIINQPQVAILSVDGIAKRPVVVESAIGDAIGIRPMGILAQSFDHRAIDGAYSGAFLARVKTLLETKDWAQEI